MDRDTRKQAQLACQISLGLMAGIFSILPTAAASPVQDTTSTGKAIQSGNFKINQSGTTDKGGTLTAITSESTNNVIPWKDFSVGAKEKVQFDNGQKTNNYLNVVTGANTSHIAGEIEGGNNVYIVNQHGVIFDEGSTVNVGNLYVSTKEAGDSDTVKAAINNNTDSAVLTTATTGSVVSDVVNLGTLNADVIQVEGKNIRFLDSANVRKADGTTRNTSDVTLTASGYAHIGHKSTGASSSEYTKGSGSADIEDYTLVSTLAEINADTTGKYMLSQDIDASGTTYTSAPISSFTGKLDGMFHEVKNLNVSMSGSSGLFGTTTGARIENLGLVDATIYNSASKSYAGGIVGNATNTELVNVYNETRSSTSAKVQGGKFTGGLVGYMSGGKLSNAYNTTSVIGGASGTRAGGLVGQIESGTIQDAYNTGAVTGTTNTKYGIASNSNQGTATITRVYNTASGVSIAYYVQSGVTLTHNFSSSSDGEKNVSTYSDWGSKISNNGTTDTTWRIYEGQDTPYLTAFFKGTSTADYKYNYFTDDTTAGATATSDGLTLASTNPTNTVTGANNGADIEATYNAQYLRVADSTGTTAGTKSDVTFGSNAGDDDSVVVVDGIRNVAVNGKTVTKQSLIYSGQHGYNIVGGNVQIDKRTVKAKSGTITGVNKEYDGTADATDAFTNTHASVSFDGLLANDSVSITNLTATYADKNVGTNKTITVTTKSDAKTFLTGDSADNYTFDATSLTNLDVKGDITPRSLYVKLKSDGSFDKFYDGTADVTSDAASVANNVSLDKTRILTVDNKADDVSLDTTNAGKVQYYNGDDTVSDSNVATNTTDDYTIRYTGLKLTGDDAGNYQLVADGTTTVLATGTTSTDAYLTAKGRINQRIIDPTAFQVQKSDGTKYTATKTYDGSSSFLLDSDTKLVPPSSTSATDDGYGFADGETIHFDLATGESAEFQDDGGNATSQVADATKLAAKVTATAGNNSTKLENYVWGKDGDTLTTYNATTKAGLYDVTTTGNITRRAITVEVTQPKDVSIDKTYDSTTAVNTTKNPEAAIFGTDGYVNYTSTSLQLANGADGTNTTADGTSFTVTPTYDNANVNRDSSGSVIARNINYTVALTGDNAANYTLNAVDANNKSLGTIDIAKSGESLDLLGEKTGASGIINPLELSSSFGTITKTYDGTTDVPADKLSATLSDGIYDADKGKVSLKSGYNAVFQSKNVKGDGTTWKDSNGKVWTNYVNYSGLALEGDNAGNYTIADTATGGGTITPLTLKAGDFEYTFGDITKTYDGNATVNNADAKLLTAKVTATGDYFKQGDTNYTSATATYKDKNSNNAAKQDVNYTVTISNDGSGNYDFSGFTDGKLTDTVTDTNGGTITRRALYASVTNTDPLTKTYDGTTDAGLAAGDASVTLTGDADHADTTGFVSGDGAANESTGAFASADVAYDTTDTDKVAAQNVNYTIKLNSDTAQDNYVVYDATDKTKELAYDTAGVLTGDGIINPATITATFGKITKVYDGTTNVAGTKALDGTTAEKQFTYSLDGVLSPNGTKDDVTISADIANAAYTDANKGIGDRDITYKFTLGGNDLRNYKLSTDTSADGYNKTHAGDYTTTIGGNSIQTKTLTKDDISVAWGNVTKVYDGSKNVAYTHKAEDGYFDGEIGSKTTSDFISTTTDNTTGLKLGGISIAKGTTGYTVSDVALFDSADTDATKATFQFTLSDDVANNFDFSGITDIYDASTRTLTRSTSDDNATASITAKQVKLDFAPLKDHSQVYNGSATLVDNSQTAPAAAAKDLSSTITGVTGLVNNEAQSVLGLSVAGAFVDTTTDGTTVRAKDAGTGKSIQYDVTLTNKNYTFYPNGTDVADAMTGTVDTTGKAITYLGTTANGYAGTITPKTLTVTAAKDSLVKTYDGTAAVEDGDLKNITFDGLIAGEDLTPGLATSTNKDGGLSAVYVDSNGNESADVEYDNGVTHKAVKVSGLKNALANATTTDTTGKVLVSNYQIADDTQTFSKDDANAVGKINQLSLGADDVTKVWTKGYTREYDGTSAIDPQKVVQLQINTSKIVGKDGKAYTLAYDGTANFLKNGSATDEQSDAGKNLGIAVNIKNIDTTADGNTNFDLSNLKDFKGTYHNYDSEANGGYGASDGVITPRLLTVTAIKDAAFNKTYDGDYYVEDPGTKFKIRHLTTDADGNVTYEQAILDKDASAVDASIGKAYYNSSSTSFAHDKNAAKDKAISVQGTITAKDPTSTTANTAANNYTLVLDTTDPTKATHTSEVFAKDEDGKLATGTIAQKEVRLVDAGNRFDKEYDTDSSVLADQLKDNFTLNSKDFVGNETLTLNYDNLKGSYVQGEATTADEQTAEKANPKSDVNWVDGKGVQDWGVLVYGAQSALADGTNGGLSSNYTIADTVYFKQAAARGQIKPIALTMSNIKEKWTPVTKTYDGTKEIKNVNSLKDPLTLYVDNYTSNAGTSGATTHAHVDDSPYAYLTYDLNGTPTYDNKNVGKTHSLDNFVVDSLTGVTKDAAGETANHNFTISSDLATEYMNKTMTSGADNVITPKQLKLSLDSTTKVYDGTTNIATDYTFAEDHGIEDVDKDTVSVAVTDGYYDSKNAGDRKVHYKVKLSRNTDGNYTLFDDTAHAEKGEETETTADISVDGTIKKRTVYVDFKNSVTRDDNGNVIDLDKEYGKTYYKTVAKDGHDAAAKEADASVLTLVKTVGKDADGNPTGLVDDDVKLDYENVGANYDSGNVKRDSNGRATTQTVTFDNFTLKDTGKTDDNGYDESLNYNVAVYGGATKLTGSGKITPVALGVTVDNSGTVAKEYDGTTALGSDPTTKVANAETMKNNLAVDETKMMLGEGISDLNFSVDGSSYATADANRTENLNDGEKNMNYVVNWDNPNYDLSFEATGTTHAMTTPTVTQKTATDDGEATFTITQGTITPRALTITGVRDTTKPYDGNASVKDIDQYANLTFDRLLDKDKTANTFATADATYYDAENKDTDANAGIAGSTEADADKNLRSHKVRYENINILNKNYELTNPNYSSDTTYSTNGYALGNGTITRAPLTLKSEPVKGRYGQMPAFTGTVTGWVNGEGADFDESSILWKTAPGASTRGSQPIYGWYHDSASTPTIDTRTTHGTTPSAAGWYKDTRDGYAATDGATSYRNFGSYGLNYQFVQDPGYYTSQADRPDGIDDALNPARRVRPDMDVYNYVSHDEAGTAIRDPKAGIEYRAGGTSLSADSSSSYTGTMKVEGAGDIVNLTQSGTQASADRVDLTGEGANYTLSGAEDVPTADVTVADVTELADELANVTDTTATAATTTNTTVTDDDDDVLKEATETTTREADAAVENTETATAATELFSDTITGTNIAS